MSVANMEPAPPLYFQHPPPPSSPPFSSPQSPHDTMASHPFSSPPPLPQTSHDIDMSTSTTLPPTGQPHDRDDAVMQDGLTNAAETTQTAANAAIGEPRSHVAVEVASVSPDEDVMDVVPHNAQSLVLPNDSADAPDAPGTSPTSPDASAVTHPETEFAVEPQPAPPSNPPHADDALIEPPPPPEPLLEPPPPPPPIEHVRSESESSDEEDGAQPWYPITEDKSTPDEEELKEIEKNPEYSALDHEHWEEIAFVPLEDPEYTAGVSGRIEWLIEAYNGTRENPNRELVMKSEPVSIGGYEWQIKFYPKGNDSDYLSVYVECLSVLDREDRGNGEGSATDTSQGGDATVTVKESSASHAEVATPSKDEAPREAQHTPLPLLGSKTVPKRKSVAAQISVVLYNPGEPRVNVARTCLHRFCSSSPDWGWTRFHGPQYEISHRAHGQRQALLRDDKLAFTGYIRIIEDETNCLWEHPSSDNAWDSFAMTGLNSLVLEDASISPFPCSGGNFISAIASWMLFKPFRQLLYSYKAPNPQLEPWKQPKPLILAFQTVLHMLRRHVESESRPTSLDPITRALEWYGILVGLPKLDVVAVWELLRSKLEEELRDSPFSDVFEDLCGPKRDYSSGVPSYRVPVVGMGSMQEAVNNSPDLIIAGTPLPKLLTIELDRQAFDKATRSYVKVLNRVSLDDHVTVRETPYTLYGFVVHKQTLQSYVYQPILRPEGPGSKWYSYTDNREDNIVKCLTKRQAVTLHEGTESKERVTGTDPIAYIAMYVRDDIAKSTFSHEPEEWGGSSQVPNVDVHDTRSVSAAEGKGKQAHENEPGIVEISEPAEEREFQVISSRAFLEHECPGTFDVYKLKWGTDVPGLVYHVQLKATDGCEQVREKLVEALGDIKDPRQVKFWFVDGSGGCHATPTLISTGKVEYSSGPYDRYVEQLQGEKLQDRPRFWQTRRIWMHVVDVDDLPELPKEEPQKPRVDQTPSSSATAEAVVQPPTEDTPMSDPDEPEPRPIAGVHPPAQSNGNNHGSDTAMVEVDAPRPADLPTVDVIIPNVGAADTEMGGTQDEGVAHPPPPSDLPAVPPPAPVEERTRTPEPVAERQTTPPLPPDELYFFVKCFDAEKQTLVPKGSFITQASSRLSSTLTKLLGLTPHLIDPQFFEEKKLVSARPLKGRKTFSSLDLHNGAVIIYAHALKDEQRDALADRAAFADLPPYLLFRSKARNFPTKLNGHFTHSYFSSQFYKGEFRNGHRHGRGYRIYHSGATYEGNFRLSLRHGEHGRYTYQNGDTYDGQWVNNQQHGTGTFTEASTGNMYMGGWKNDKKFGEGVTHWKNAEQMERLCRICMEADADAAFYDCGHVVACLGCAQRVENCPVCRKRVLSAMKLYYVA